MADGSRNSKSQSSDSNSASSPSSASQRYGHIPPSPPRFISIDELMNASNLVTNMALAHEIAIDEDFRLEKNDPPEGSLEKIVSDTMHRAFWDSLVEKLSMNPPDYSHAIVLIEEIKQKLLNCLLPQHQRFRTLIDEVMDMELIQQKINNDAFDIKYYAEFVQSLMSQLCAPVRDEDVARIKDNSKIVPLFKEIFRLLDIMALDMANAQIQQMRPYLKQQSITYEMTKFDELLQRQEANGIDGLEFTRQWLDRSFEPLDEQEANHKELYCTNLKEIPRTPANILHGAYMELLNWSSDHVFPETCLMDQQRFLEIGYNIRKLTLLSSAILIACNTVGDWLTGHTHLRDKLKKDGLSILADVPDSQFSSKIVNVAEHVVSEVNKELQERGYPVLDEGSLSVLKSRIIAVTEPENNVYSLIYKRIMTFIFQSLNYNNRTPLQLPQGLAAVTQELASYSGKFLKLVSHNKAVFGHWYADIIGGLMHATNLSPRIP